jgi:KamA family protein
MKVYTRTNLREIPQISTYFNEDQLLAMEAVSLILPFKTNNYVLDQLIHWDNIPHDPMFLLSFPQKEMLREKHFSSISRLLNEGADKEVLKREILRIRTELNPNPAGQLKMNIPEIDGEKVYGLQHKYRETVLFFPAQGQGCHAFCTFCFRWSQFVRTEEERFSGKEIEQVVHYLNAHPEVTDILLTGGDPMVMSTETLSNYLLPLVDQARYIRNIRIGTKSLTYWPYRYTTDADSPQLLALFRRIGQSGKQLAFMAHFNHYQELETDVLREAVKAIQSTGAVIRTQAPLLRYINDRPEVWKRMWEEQLKLGMVPYYFFIARNTGAQHFFAVPLAEAWNIFKTAYSSVSGIHRTVRGPSMSAGPGKVQVLGISKVHEEEVFVLRFIQGRDPDWVARPFFAHFDPKAIWLNELKPAFGEQRFFWQE